MSVSVADNFAVADVQAPLSVALRNVFASLALSVLTLAAVGLFWREQGYEILIVAMGWPHVLLGFTFFFGRVLRGEQDSRLTFLVLGLATLAICVVHYYYSITGLIYLYFLFHLFRDEIFVYLQTRSRHQLGSRVYAVAGVAPLILLILLIPRQQDFRHDLRRTEFTGAQVASQEWTLVPFKAVPNSSGRDFYFYLQAPHTAGLRAFITRASGGDLRSDGEMIVGKGKWDQAADLVFAPHYSGDPEQPPVTAGNGDVPVLLTGGHSVGQTFRAEKNHLDGIWLPVDRFEQPGETTRFVFHMASPPLLPYSVPVDRLRIMLMLILGAVVIWRLLPRQRNSWQLWIYLGVLAVGFFGTQAILKSSNNAGYAFPLIFQFAVVFHYWSWYVFSFDKLRAKPRTLATTSPRRRPYDKLLSYLGNKRHFTIAVIVMNLISAGLVFWYYKLGGPGQLRYFFDYNYFLYFLVFHVTFSFRPRLRAATM
jgi:hypothetical protein